MPRARRRGAGRSRRRRRRRRLPPARQPRSSSRFGRVDVLVNNAGTTKFVAAKDLDGLDADDFHRIYGINVIGAFQMVRALEPMLALQPGAAIVNVSSIASLMGTGSSLAYMASKGALNALTIGPRARARAADPGQRDRARPRRDAVDAEGPRPRALPGDGAKLPGPRRARCGRHARRRRRSGLVPRRLAAKTTGEVLLLDAGLRLRRD